MCGNGGNLMSSLKKNTIGSIIPTFKTGQTNSIIPNYRAIPVGAAYGVMQDADAMKKQQASAEAAKAQAAKGATDAARPSWESEMAAQNAMLQGQYQSAYDKAFNPAPPTATPTPTVFEAPQISTPLSPGVTVGGGVQNQFNGAGSSINNIMTELAKTAIKKNSPLFAGNSQFF